MEKIGNNKIKVAVITDLIDINKVVGIKVYILKLLKNLKKNKNIELWLIHSKKDSHLIYKKTNQIIISTPRLPLISSILRYKFQIPGILKKMKFDIVHDPDGIGIISKLPQKHIKTIYDMVPFKFPNTQTLINNLLYKFFFYLTNRYSDKIITVSQNSKKDIIECLKIPNQKINVVYIGYDKSRFKPIKNSEVRKIKQKFGKFLLFVGTLEPRKNIVRIIQAFSRINKQFPDYSLVIIGKKGWKYDAIFKEVKKLDLAKKINFLEWIEHDKLPLFYNAAELFVFPSLYEGFGLPPLEAMACGCPVITSNVSSLPEVVGDAAIKVNPYSVDEIAEAMRKVLSDEKLRKKMTEKGLRQCKKFGWEKCAEETFKIYEEILREK